MWNIFSLFFFTLHLFKILKNLLVTILHRKLEDYYLDIRSERRNKIFSAHYLAKFVVCDIQNK